MSCLVGEQEATIQLLRRVREEQEATIAALRRTAGSGRGGNGWPETHMAHAED